MQNFDRPWTPNPVAASIIFIPNRLLFLSLPSCNSQLQNVDGCLSALPAALVIRVPLQIAHRAFTHKDQINAATSINRFGSGSITMPDLDRPQQATHDSQLDSNKPSMLVGFDPDSLHVCSSTAPLHHGAVHAQGASLPTQPQSPTLRPISDQNPPITPVQRSWLIVWAACWTLLSIPASSHQ